MSTGCWRCRSMLSSVLLMRVRKLSRVWLVASLPTALSLHRSSMSTSITDVNSEQLLSVFLVDVSTCCQWLLHWQCTGCQNSPPQVFWHSFPNCSVFFDQILHACYSFLSTIDYGFLFNYLQLWWSYAILSVTTQFTSYAQNVYHWPKRKLAFSNVFPSSWEFLVQILHTYYSFISMLEYKFLFIYLQLWQSYAILSATTQRAFRPVVDILCIWWWSASRLIWHNFVKVAGNCIKFCGPA